MMRRALGLILERRSQCVRGLIFLCLVVEFEQVPIGIGKLVRFAVPQVAIDPAPALTTRFDGWRQPFQRLWAPGAKGGVSNPGLRGFGQFERVAFVLAPGA